MDYYQCILCYHKKEAAKFPTLWQKKKAQTLKYVKKDICIILDLNTAQDQQDQPYYTLSDIDRDLRKSIRNLHSERRENPPLLVWQVTRQPLLLLDRRTLPWPMLKPCHCSGYDLSSSLVSPFFPLFLFCLLLPSATVWCGCGFYAPVGQLLIHQLWNKYSGSSSSRHQIVQLSGCKLLATQSSFMFIRRVLHSLSLFTLLLQVPHDISYSTSSLPTLPGLSLPA